MNEPRYVKEAKDSFERKSASIRNQKFSKFPLRPKRICFFTALLLVTDTVCQMQVILWGSHLKQLYSRCKRGLRLFSCFIFLFYYFFLNSQNKAWLQFSVLDAGRVWETLILNSSAFQYLGFKDNRQSDAHRGTNIAPVCNLFICGIYIAAHLTLVTLEWHT